MASPTAPKLAKIQRDISKMLERLATMRSDLASMSANPRGSDVEIARIMKDARDEMGDAREHLLAASERLDAPVSILNRRKGIK